MSDHNHDDKELDDDSKVEQIAQAMPGAGRLNEPREGTGETEVDLRPDTQAPAG
jgi:hypothetical protein